MATSHHRHTSLLVVNEVALASMSKGILESNDYQVDMANNGNETILLIKDKEYDLVISDTLMGGEDGFTLKDFIYNKYPSLKVLFTSGYYNSDKAKKYSGKIMSKLYGKEKLLKHAYTMLK